MGKAKAIKAENMQKYLRICIFEYSHKCIETCMCVCASVTKLYV